VRCDYYDAGTCRSCTLIELPYPRQVGGKVERCRELLAGHPDLQWLPPVLSPEAGYRNKAKMVVGGTVAEPTLGILDPAGHGVDLRRCGVCAPGVRAALPALAAFITRAGLVPYDVPARRGELKNVIVTEAPDGALMVRFVVRSQAPVHAIRKNLPALLEALPRAEVVTANLLPEHKAVVEGDTEVVLSDRRTLTMRSGAVDLNLRPQSFFQTNTTVATALYEQARAWVDEIAPGTLWDLFCGVGGFALHCAAPGRRTTGVESSAEAVESARRSAADAGLVDLEFLAGDATAFALTAAQVPDAVVVNPPRRGIGVELAGWLEASGARHVLYSSCNPVTLAQDLRAMPSLRPVRARLLDMFPQTHHVEVLTLLERR